MKRVVLRMRRGVCAVNNDPKLVQRTGEANRVSPTFSFAAADEALNFISTSLAISGRNFSAGRAEAGINIIP
jgi:hypothetical protein